MKWKHKGHEYDSMEAQFDNTYSRYYIWGAGTFGIAFYEEFYKEFEFVAFVDRDEHKQGKEICGLKVISPLDFQRQWKDEIVIVSTGMTKSVYDQLEEFGLVRHKNFYHIDEISSIYMMHKYNKVYISDLTIPITQYCTLKCEYCNAFIPKIENPINFDIKFIQEELKSYFRWVDEVNILGLVGGDAMSHPQFNEILKWVGDTYYPHIAKHIEIYSNAVIKPTNQTIELFKKYNIFYRFTDYYGHSGKQDIKGITDLLSKNNIRYDHVKFTTWFDCGYPQKSNGITTKEGLSHFFDMCDRKSCHTLWGNQLFFCGNCINADWINYCKIQETDYFDLSKYSESRRKEFIEYNLGYSEKGYMEYCKMCNGSISINTHKIEVGEQIQ
ncbi:MAG: hypothetical protein NC118_05945 [Eubacterium sp.]|nr:hypothetical protein [Eubacterium sp.]